MNQEQVWDILAESWNNFRQKTYKRDIYSLRWTKGRLLDIGCGNCRNLKPFANLELYGMDFSSKMLNFAKVYSEKHGIKVRLMKADMKKIPFNNDFFDYCLCINSLHHLNKKEADEALKEVYRVLKNDGECYISVWNRNPVKSLFIGEERYISWRQKDNVHKRYYYFHGYFGFKKLLRKNKFKIIKSGRIFDKNIKFLIQK